jgi:hypothetical protein
VRTANRRGHGGRSPAEESQTQVPERDRRIGEHGAELGRRLARWRRGVTRWPSRPNSRTCSYSIMSPADGATDARASGHARPSPLPSTTRAA